MIMDEPNTATAEQVSIVESFPEERAAKRIRVDSPADHGKTSVEQAAISVNGTQPDGTKETKDDKASGPTEEKPSAQESKSDDIDGRVKGLAPIKKEYLISRSSNTATSTIIDDDAAEARGSTAEAERRDDRDSGPKKEGRKKSKGQNTERSFGRSEDALMLCNTRALAPELSPRGCRFGDRCKMSHDLRKYLKEGRREDVGTFDGQCPVFGQHGHCPSGWKCRFVKSHMKEIEHDDGRHELVLIDNRPGKLDRTHHAEIDAEQSDERMEANDGNDESDHRPGVYNVVSKSDKIQLGRRRIDFAKANEYIQWLNHETGLNTDFHNRRKAQSQEGIEDLRAQFVDPPFMPSEKRRLYFGPETPTLAPLTTQGNLPFRRLCVELGCQLTYSEMAYSMPLLNGVKADWALMKAHESEISPPKIGPAAVPMFDDYDNSRDLRFGAQIEGSAPWVVTKAVDALNRYCPHLRLIDLNCGCPIDKVFKGGAGSALLDATGKMERMIRGMNAMSGEIPITAKLRTGIRGNRPVATQIIGRLAFGSREHRERLGAPGCAAVTLHGRSREQRYTKTADWGYIGECAALIRSYNSEKAALTDTAAEPDARTLPNAKDGRMYFLGNGDCFSHVDYYEHVDKARVDSVMIGRGALIKPWIFEEIERGQYLDKSSGERLRYVEKFARYGLEAWGSDELGIGFTRRFLLEWLSFAHRYVPVGILEHLPPRLNDRPPAFRGRDDMETLMASENYKDWIKITEMFLGPAHPNFQFQPKHKSNSYETEG